MMEILIYHPEFDRLEYWDDSGLAYYPHHRQMHRNIWASLEYAMEMGWEVIGVI